MFHFPQKEQQKSFIIILAFVAFGTASDFRTMNFNAETPTEIITPYKVVLIAIISNFCHISDGRCEKVFDISDFGDVDREKKRKFYMSLLNWTYRPEGCLKDILQGVALFSKVLHDSVVRSLQELCDSPSGDDIDIFFSNFSSLFADPPFTRTLQLEGAIALFGRRLVLNYERMDYSQFREIQKDLTKYCAILLESKKSARYQHLMRASSDGFTDAEDSDSIDEMELESQSEMDSKSSDGSTRLADLKSSDLKTEVKFVDVDALDIYTSRQADFFCSKQAALIIDKENYALPPDKLQSKISQMLKNNPKLTEVHYLGYLNCLRIKEFCGAVDHLLTYFNKNAKLEKPTSEDASDFLETYECIFAALHLAQFYYKLGHKNAAIAATREAVDLCQLAGDTRCLQHAMCLMAELDPENVQLSLLDHQLKPTIAMKLYPLASKALLRDATKQAMTGKRPRSIFTKLAANEALARSNANQSLNLTGYAYKAALWRLYGKTQMASLFCQMALSNHRTGYQGYHSYSWQPNTSDIAISLCHLCEILHESGEIAGSQEIVQHLKHRFPMGSEHSKLWQVTELRLKHIMALRSCKYSEASQAEIDLVAFDESEAEFRKAERLYLSGDQVKAHDILQKLLQTDVADKPNDNHDLRQCSAELRCQIFMYLGCILFNENSDNAAATQYLLKALSTAGKHYLHKFLVKSKLLLAQLQMYSSCFNNAKRTLQSCFYECLTHGTAMDKCCMKMVEAKCTLFANSHPTVSDIDEAIAVIEKLNCEFEKLQDLHKRKDAAYYLARLHHKKSLLLKRSQSPDPTVLVDAVSNRNKFSSLFKQIDSVSFSSPTILLI